MKKIYYIFIAIAWCISSCTMDLPTELEYSSYQFASIDPDGGSWKPILIQSGASIYIPPPSNTSSPEYLAELEMVKKQISSMNSEQRKLINQWTNNPVVRWNEIALELIAKYNLIPGPNADGSYPAPSPSNPEGPPKFPFAHPPYASRVLAYLSVGQFDGLISAWHYKFKYNREAPYVLDPSIKHAFVANPIPSYPSGGAVIAEVSATILKTMFPLEVAYLEQKKKEHLEALLLSGENVPSDLEAGILIGEEIASIALTRASGDGMKNAQTSKAVSDSIANAAFERFGWVWINQESPQRPVGLTPLFGKVRMWNVSNVELTRPPAPPAIDSEEYNKDVQILIAYLKENKPEHRKIANFWQDGLGTYTPPGHWNDFANRFIVEAKMNPIRSARTLAYMNMAIMDAGISCWDAKYYYHYPRPIQTIEGFKTIAGTPNFPSYTSGHSVFSAAGAEVLAYIFPEKANLVRGWAKEAAISRVYGGIHWTFDATVGTAQGIDVANYTINAAIKDGADF